MSQLSITHASTERAHVHHRFLLLILFRWRLLLEAEETSSSPAIHYIWHIKDIYRIYIYDIYRTYTGHSLYRTYTGHIQDIYRTYTGNIQDILYIGHYTEYIFNTAKNMPGAICTRHMKWRALLLGKFHRSSAKIII